MLITINHGCMNMYVCLCYLWRYTVGLVTMLCSESKILCVSLYVHWERGR